jgi:hypothetical protein
MDEEVTAPTDELEAGVELEDELDIGDGFRSQGCYL